MAFEDDGKYGLADPANLEKIDKLFACGVGDIINLPQIVVVGDQSSGKSSVLEGLIRKPLPRDSGLCTRFATQIIFKRSPKDMISVSIIPGVDATEEHKTSLQAWSRRELDVLDPEAFKLIMDEVHEAMGVSPRGDGSLSKGSTFSRDVLRLEICGPTQEHLSVIDVPGIFKNTTPGLTTKNDIALVRGMVQGYMENPRSVMLTVIPSNVDVATQEILEMAVDVDPDGKRTLGVLTKPDLVDHGAESRVIDLLEGRAHPLKLGWHVVRNPGQIQLADESLDRGSIEQEFFSFSPYWKDIEPDKKSINALRVRIQAILNDLVRQEFPKVKQEMLRKLTSTKDKLGQLGVERETTEKQLLYLIDLSSRFQRKVSLSIDAKYGSDELFENMDLRLATLISTRNEQFSNDMSYGGHEYQFWISEAAGKTEDLEEGEENGDSEISTPGNSASSCDSNSYGGEPFRIRKLIECEDIEEFLRPQDELASANTTGITQWLEGVYRSSRGFELGTFDSAILSTTMKVQSRKWIPIALGYISDVVTMVHRFIDRVLDVICPDQSLKAEMLSVLWDSLVERYTEAIEHVQFLLRVELEGTPMTMNHYFNDNLQNRRQKRMQARMSDFSIDTAKYGKVVRIADTKTTHLMSNAEHVVEDIHDILFSYYKVARKRFVDSVCMQAADHFLVNGPTTPLALFSPTFVSNLSVEQLESIAGEDQGTRRMRFHLKKDIASLEEARKILK